MRWCAGRGLSSDTVRFSRTAPRLWCLHGTSNTRNAMGLLGGDDDDRRPSCWMPFRENLSDTYVRSQVIIPFFDPLFFSDLLSLAMFFWAHGSESFTS